MLTFAAGPHTADAPTIPLPHADARSASFDLRGAASAACTISAHDETSAELLDALGMDGLTHDLWVWRDIELLLRGRILPPAHNITADAHTVGLSAIDYRGVLGRVPMPHPPLKVTSQPQSGIAWLLIIVAQNNVGAELGITAGTFDGPDPVRDRTEWEPGKPIGECLEELGAVDGGFEWEIDSLRQLNTWSPRRGEDRPNVVFAWPQTAIDANAGRAIEDIANAVIATGNPEQTTPVTLAAGDVGTDPRGRWTTVVQSQNVTRQATLNARAPRLLADAQASRADWQMTLLPGIWEGRASAWLGDTVRFAVTSGPLAEAGPARLTQLAINEADGAETVTVTLEAP